MSIDLVANCFLIQLRLLAQDVAPAGGAGGGAAPEGSLFSPFVLPAGLLFLFYFIVIAPERRRKKEETRLMMSLKKNDRVVTIGGIHAVVANVTADSDLITLRIDEGSGTRIKVNRSAISRIVTDKDSTHKTTSETTKDAGSDAKD